MVFYFVQRGETLYAIAKRYQTTVHAIVAANRLEDPNAICPGQALVIPRPGEIPSPPPGGIVHLVRPGETVFQLSTKFGTPAHDILRVNQIAHPEFILPGQQLVIPEPIEIGDDWPMFGRTPGRVNAGPVELEGVPLPGWCYSPRKNVGVLPSAAVVRYDRVYVALGDGFFYSFDRFTGRVKWRIGSGRTESGAEVGNRPMPTPAVHEGIVYLCGPDGLIQAVDAYSGQPIWRLVLNGRITSAPAVAGGVIYLGGWDKNLYAIEAKTGAIAWKRTVGSPVAQPVAVGDDRVYSVSTHGLLQAVNAHTGEVGWSAQTDTETPPVYAEIAILCGSQAFDPVNGDTLWTTEADVYTPVVWIDQVIYATRAVDLFTGAELWSRCDTELPARSVTGPLVVGTGRDRRLHAWSARDGAAIWSADLNGFSVQPPAIAPGQVFVTLDDGSLTSFRMKSAPA